MGGARRSAGECSASMTRVTIFRYIWKLGSTLTRRRSQGTCLSRVGCRLAAPAVASQGWCGMSVTSWSQQWIVCSSCGEIVLYSGDARLRRLYHAPKCRYQGSQMRETAPRGELPASVALTASPVAWEAERPSAPGAGRAVTAARHASLAMRGRHRPAGRQVFRAAARAVRPVIELRTPGNVTGKTVLGLGAGLSVVIVTVALVISRSAAKTLLPTASQQNPSPVPTAPSSTEPGPRNPAPSHQPAGGTPHAAPPPAAAQPVGAMLTFYGHGTGPAEPVPGKHHEQTESHPSASQPCYHQRVTAADYQFRPFYGGRHDHRRRIGRAGESGSDHGWSNAHADNYASGWSSPSNSWPQN
jgi:hypothetical protein